MKGKRIFAMLVAIVMIGSAMVVPSLWGQPVATPEIELSKDGSVYNLTCGETITVKVTNNGLDKDTDHTVAVWNGSDWIAIGDGKSDKHGDISVDVTVPCRDDLGKDPVGDWKVNIFNTTDSDELDDTHRLATNKTIIIGNIYDVRYKWKGEWIDHLVYNTSYVNPNPLTIDVRKYTGSGWDSLTETADENLNITVFYPNGDEIDDISDQSGGSWTFNLPQDKTTFKDGNNLETTYWVNVTNHDNSSMYSNVTMPVKLNISEYDAIPDSITWGESISFTLYVQDGQGNAQTDYPMKIYYPVDGDYERIGPTSTDLAGYYNANNIDTKEGSAGTWYVGTEETGSDRIVDTGKPDNILTDFIPYYSFEVNTKTGATVAVENSGDITSGFDQTINVSVKNMSWMDDEYKNMNIHVTGLKGWNESKSVEYAKDDIVPVADSTDITKSDDDYAYYEFTYRFNKTGEAKIWASWPGNLTDYEYHDSTYSDTYDNEDLEANITGYTTFDVVSPGPINMFMEGTMVDGVVVNDLGSNCWQNGSDTFNISIYGSTQNDEMNATLDITGCGLDFTIEEDDALTDSDYLNDKGNGWYEVTISPKVGGTLTITATNGSDSTSEDYTISGLGGSVTTSIGDDKEITAETVETITATVTNGQYAEVHVTYFDENWDNPDCINYTTGDGTTGNGENGVFTFTPDEEDLKDVGYLVVAAKAGSDIYMYDIVEIIPVHDLTLNVTTPAAGNQTLTVGKEEDISLTVKDPNGSIVDDVDSVTGKLYDMEDELVQTISFSEDGDTWEVEDQILWQPGELVITAVNNSGTNEHDGNITLDVEKATVTYTPAGLLAGIGQENVTINITAVDANGNALNGVTLYLNSSVLDIGTDTDVSSIDLDEDGAGSFKVETVGDETGNINATLQNNNPEAGNETAGEVTINFPDFTVEPDTIYIGQANTVTIWAKDYEGNPIPNINLTLWPTGFSSVSAPDPVLTDSDGKAIFSISPTSSGTFNVTIVKSYSYVDGSIHITNENRTMTNTTLTVTAKSPLSISVSKSPIYEGETLTVTATSNGNAVSDVIVEFGGSSATTDAEGETTFTVSDPGVESAVYTVSADKTGYTSTDKSITVIKTYGITIVGPETNPSPGEKFTVTVMAKGSPLAGATAEFNGKTYTTDGQGQVELTAPSGKGDYTVGAMYENYEKGELTVTVKEGGGVPGFELLTLVAALGVVFLLLRRRRK